MENPAILIANVTAVYGKHDRIFGMPFTYAALFETSATRVAQLDFQQQARKERISVQWSKPVGAKVERTDGKDSLRGDAHGVACLSRGFARPWRGDIPLHVSEASRILPTIVQMPFAEILLVTVYGFPKCHKDARTKNAWILEEAFKMATDARIPFIVAGDFNDNPRDNPANGAFSQLGCYELFDLVQNKWGKKLPPTCKGATQYDTAIIHPRLVPYIKEVSVLTHEAFDVQSPVLIRFDESKARMKVGVRSNVQSFATLDIPRNAWEQVYQERPRLDNQQADTNKMLQSWAAKVEDTLSIVLKQQHRENTKGETPNGLPKRMRGRCGDVQIKEMHMPYAPRQDKSKQYEPPEEVFALSSRHKVRQVRRLRGLLASLQSQQRQRQDIDTERKELKWKHQNRQEWKSILCSRGYGSTWANWILSFDIVGMLPLDEPTIWQLEDYVKITQHDCDATCKREAQQRRQSFQEAVKRDLKSNHGRLIYKLVKNKGPAPLRDVPVEISTDVTLLRLERGQLKGAMRDRIDLRIGQDARWGNAIVTVDRIAGKTLHMTLQQGSVPTQAILRQEIICVTPPEVFAGVRGFWGPIWNREKWEEQEDAEKWDDAKAELAAIPVPENLRADVKLACKKTWIKTIKAMKSRSSAGFGQWRSEELKVLPDGAIEELIQIAQQVFDTSVPENLMHARMVLLAKRPVPRNFGDSRPITIMGVLYRLLTKLVADQLLSAWAPLMPPYIAGGLPGRGAREVAYMQQMHLEATHHNGQKARGFTLGHRESLQLFSSRTNWVDLSKTWSRQGSLRVVAQKPQAPPPTPAAVWSIRCYHRLHNGSTGGRCDVRCCNGRNQCNVLLQTPIADPSTVLLCR